MSNKELKREKLKKIYMNTLKYSYEIYNDCEKISLNKMILKKNSINENYKKKFINTKICVLNEDVIQTTINLYNEINNNNILIHCMSSNKKFGGGVKNGSMAQEEEIFRKTNIGLFNGMKFYPLNNDYIFANNISIIKDKYYNKLNMKNIFNVNIILLAAINKNNQKNNTFTKEEYDLTCFKIENIFKIAIENNIDNLVLGAFGCGVFNNPVNDIINIYNIYLEKYNGYFDNIIFSVKSVYDNNFKLFNENIIKKF